MKNDSPVKVIWAASPPDVDLVVRMDQAGLAWRLENDARYFLRLAIAENPGACVVLDKQSELSAAELRFLYPSTPAVYLYTLGDDIAVTVELLPTVPREDTSRVVEEILLAILPRSAPSDSIEILSAANRDKNIPAEQRLNRFLQYGLKRFDLDLAIVSDIAATKYVVLASQSSANVSPASVGDVFDLGMTYCAITVAERSVVAIHHVRESEYSGHPCYTASGLESYIAVPLWHANKVIGTLNFSSPLARKPFSIDELHEISKMAALVENVFAEKIVTRAGFIDALTGLTTRAIGEQDIEKLYMHKQSFHMFFIDMNNLKSINDVHGHASGDLALKEVAQRLRSSFRDQDYLIRWGDDEFVAICFGCDNDELAVIQSNMVEQMSKPYAVGDSCISLAVSVGMAASPETDTWRALVDLADNRMYRLKTRGAMLAKIR